jgi:glycosyltransferase involved in cell wall biosynthesis
VHVLHVIARLNNGGPARVLMALAPVLRQHGISTKIVAGRCAADERDLTEQVRAAGIEVITLPQLQRATTPWNDALAFVSLYRVIKRMRPAVVHTHTAKAGALGRTACRLLGVTCVHTYHGHVLHGYFSEWMNKIVQMAERLLAGPAWHHALTTTQWQELAVQHAIGRRSRWCILPVPVTPVISAQAPWQQQLRPGVPVIGFLGRLAAVKDVWLWLDTLELIAQHLSVQGIICGDGVELSPLKERLRRMSVPVLCTGFVPAGEALQVMDVLLLTSRNEGLPLTVIEAIGCTPRAVPVVAPPVGGLRDLISQGVVVGAPRRASALAQACLRVLHDAQLQQQTARQGRLLAQQLAPLNLARAYAQLYHRIGASYGPKPRPQATAAERKTHEEMVASDDLILGGVCSLDSGSHDIE